MATCVLIKNCDEASRFVKTSAVIVDNNKTEIRNLGLFKLFINLCGLFDFLSET
jgi:hypothetical protein